MKKVLVIVMSAFCVNFAHAAYLYWQVDNSDFSNLTDVNAQYARVVAVSEGGQSQVLNLVDSFGSATDDTMISIDTGRAAVSLGTLDSSTAYSFFIELLNYNTDPAGFNVVAKSQTMTYADLQAKNFIDVGEVMQLPPSQVWHGGTYSVPEPTSAMLVMFGMGLLALKRKRV